ncbi:MAG: class I SAM-dependent DNA methyltransferase, partial [Clostridia bacterium]|nr:class I SAM-dependent DNA methyltransferase [Clostridia bacterium]
MDLTGITNQNEYYTNHYFSSIFEENASDTISGWRAEAKESNEIRTPWARLRDAARQYYPIHDRYLRSRFDTQTLANIRMMADMYLSALDYPEAAPDRIAVDDETVVPVYLELKKPNGAPALWVLLAASEDRDAAILDKLCFSGAVTEEGLNSVSPDLLTNIPNEALVTKILFGQPEPPRFVILIGMNQIALIDRNKWNEKRYLQFELEDIFSRLEESTLQAMAVLLHRDSLCPEEGTALLDELDANSQKHAAGVSQDLKYALREAIELLGNEVLYDMAHRQGRDLNAEPVDPGELTLECLRYMYRMLFVLFIEARPELGYAPIKAQAYLSGYSLESLRDIADDIRDDIAEVGSGYYLHETLSKLYDLIYSGYPKSEQEFLKYASEESLHDMFVIAPLKAHIFDPEYTKMITRSRLRNSVMLRIIDLMSLTRETGRRNDRRGRISYANLGINQMGSVYEALLSYRGFIAEHTLFEVKRAGDSFNELDVGYFVAEEELGQYTEDERVRYERDDPDGRYKKGDLRRYEKGSFIYRLAGREREKSASYYTPEVLTKCLVKYALKELLEGKTADEILQLTVCEPAMGSAAFLNEAINQLAEAYLDRKQKELGEMIPAEKRLQELQKVKMYIADRNVYGIDLNPVAVELAEVSLWLNTIYAGGFVPWFGTQLVNGNSLIGARRQCYRKEQLFATSKGLRWFENEPERIAFSKKDKNGKNINPRTYNQIYHFLLGDPGMCDYTDKVIKSLEPENINRMKKWNKEFTRPYTDEEFVSLQRLSKIVDALWQDQIQNRKILEQQTRDELNIYGRRDTRRETSMSIREKDKYLQGIYKSEHAQNAGSYARLKFAMDYWCALWFWPIDKAELLPDRNTFLSELEFILKGVMPTSGEEVERNLSLFDDEEDDQEVDIQEVNIDQLCELFPRLKLVRKIAEQNHFLHWELEFADLFAERGGFDLTLGNPPWIKIEWIEQDILSDSHPVFAIKSLTAPQVASHRVDALRAHTVKQAYYYEYQAVSGEQAFCNAVQNYNMLRGQQTNLYKCFLPQAWTFSNNMGISAFIHPEGVYDEPRGGELRRAIYPRLRKHLQFRNELKLFAEIHHSRIYSLNIYSNRFSSNFE